MHYSVSTSLRASYLMEHPPSIPITRILPSEIQLQIFSHLGWESHLICARVCALWRDLIRIHGHTFPCKGWDSSYSGDTSPGIHKLLRSYEIQLVIYNQELVSVSIHKIAAADFSIFGPIGDLVWAINPRGHWLLQHPLFRHVAQPDQDVETLEGFCHGVEDPNSWESAVVRFEQYPEKSLITIKDMLDILVAMILRQVEGRKWKLMKMRVRYVMVSGGEFAVFWGKFIRGAGDRRADIDQESDDQENCAYVTT